MIPRALLLVIYCIVRNSAAQTIGLTSSLTPSVAVNPVEPTPAGEPCDICSLAPATTDTTTYNATKQESFLLFTAYYVASQYLSNGTCQFTLASLIPLSPIVSVSQPATVGSTKFQSTAVDSFFDYLGFSTCSGQGEEVTVVAITTSTILTTSSLSPSTTTSSSPYNSTQFVPTHSSGSHDSKVKIGTAVAFPVALLALLSLAYVMYKRRKTQKALAGGDATLQKQESPHGDIQPYLQQKSELEAEENRKLELEARERRYEMGSEGERHELPVEGANLTTRTRQELRGEEHSKELDVPC